MKIEIVPATIAMATYVAAFVRERDKLEHDCFFAGDITETCAMGVVASNGWAYCALIDGNPEFLFGVVRMPDADHAGVAWGYGTKHAWKTIPTVGKFAQTKLGPALVETGVKRVEVRVLAENADSVLWLSEFMGAKHETVLRHYGKNGETFIQLAWTVDDVHFQDPKSETSGGNSESAGEDGR